MRGAPQVGFSETIRKIKARSSLLTRFRPPTWVTLVPEGAEAGLGKAGLEGLEERSKGPYQQIGHGETSLSSACMKDKEAKKTAATAASVLPATAD
jgi:hypothetical protein